MPNSYLLILTVIETVFGIASGLWLVRRSWQERHTQGWKNLAPFAAMLICLTFSSHAYCAHLLYGEVYPRWLFFVAELCGPLDYLFCALTVWRRFMVGRQWSPSQLAFSAPLFVVCLWLAIKYAVLPIQAATGTIDIYSRATNALIWPIASLLLAVAIRFSQQTITIIDTLFLQSAILILIAAIATEHQLAVSYYAVTSWSEVAWATGFSGLAAAVFLDSRAQNPVLHRPAQLSEWFSLRSLIGASVFASSVILLAGLCGFGLLTIDNGSELTIVLLLVYTSWCVSIVAALILSFKIRDVRALMPLPAAEHNDAFDAFKIKAVPQRTLLAEVDSIIEGYNERVAQLKTLNTALLENERQVALGKLATQVAHDIRSPLAALNVAMPYLQRLDEDVRLLLRDGIRRIQDIAQDLLDCHREKRTLNCEEEVVLLSIAIEQTVSQVRLQHRHKLGLSVHAEIHDSCACVFARAQPQRFKRVLSNLINNAVEAIEDAGTVTVRVYRDGASILVGIDDTGKGMSRELLGRLGQEGMTSGKVSGNGLGVYQAMRETESWGGRLAFSSQIGRGTRVMMTLHEGSPPPWIQTEIWTEGVQQVVVLDDDVSIHRIWRDRFHKDINIISTSTAIAFEEAAAGLDSADDTLYLVDYDISEANQTGVDIVEKLGLFGATLVTSHFEDPDVIRACNRAGLCIIPKSLAGSIRVRGDECPSLEFSPKEPSP